MPRLAATPDQIRATVLAMLTEAGDAAPPTAARFRRVVSVRKLRDRLGGGDPATLSRTLNAIEAEVVRSGLADLALPEIPVEIAEAMRALWQAAVAVQLDDVVRLKREAQATADTAEAAGVNPVGAAVWKMMDGRRSLEEIVAAIGLARADDNQREYAEKIFPDGTGGIEFDQSWSFHLVPHCVSIRKS